MVKVDRTNGTASSSVARADLTSLRNGKTPLKSIQPSEDEAKKKVIDGDHGQLLEQTGGQKNLEIHKLAKIFLVPSRQVKPTADHYGKGGKLFERKNVMKRFNA